MAGITSAWTLETEIEAIMQFMTVLESAKWVSGNYKVLRRDRHSLTPQFAVETLTNQSSHTRKQYNYNSILIFRIEHMNIYFWKAITA